MPYGLKDIELAKLNEVFAANERIERVILYGSRAKGNYKPFSDVDITLEGAELTHTDLNRISLAIDDLLLPYQFDISIFHTLKNEALIDHIRRMGITIYERESEWKEYKLGDLIQSVSDTYRFKPNEKVVFLNTSDILDGKFLTNSLSDVKTLPGQAKKRIQKGDILFSEIRPANKRFALVNFDCDNYVVSTKLMVLRCNENVDNRFIYTYLTSSEVLDYLQMVAEDRSGTFPQITFDIIAKMDIELPPLPTQRRIAAILSSLDDKIDLLHRENATLEQMAETLFRQWFVVEAKEEWEDVLLGNLIDIGSGKGLQRSDFVENGLYSVLGANGDIGKTNKYLVDESNRVIYTGRVGTLGNVFKLENKKAWLSDNTLVIKPKEYYNFVYFVLKLSRLQDYNVGSTQPLIRQSDIKEIELVLPDRGIMNAFEKECDLIYEKVENNNKQIQTLIQMRDGLLPRLMGGEVKL